MGEGSTSVSPVPYSSPSTSSTMDQGVHPPTGHGTGQGVNPSPPTHTPNLAPDRGTPYQTGGTPQRWHWTRGIPQPAWHLVDGAKSRGLLPPAWHLVNGIGTMTWTVHLLRSRRRTVSFYVNVLLSLHFCVVLGLDKLIEHYRTSARGLPTKLTTLCKSRRPPPLSCAYGYSNILHRAILSGTVSYVNERNNSLVIFICLSFEDEFRKFQWVRNHANSGKCHRKFKFVWCRERSHRWRIHNSSKVEIIFLEGSR